MSLLYDLFKIPEVSYRANPNVFLLNTPVSSQHTFHLDNYNIDLGKRCTLLWNFGDPSAADYVSTNNEIISNNVLDIHEHVYKTPGVYEINCIANFDGVLFHLNSFRTIQPDGNLILPDKTSGTYYVDLSCDNKIEVSLYCFDIMGKIYYSLDGASYSLYDASTPIEINESSHVLNYYAILNNGDQTPTYSNVYDIVKYDYILSVSPTASSFPIAQTIYITSDDPFNLFGEYSIKWTSTIVQTPQTYTEGGLLVNQSTTLTFWVEQIVDDITYTYPINTKQIIISNPQGIGNDVIPIIIY